MAENKPKMDELEFQFPDEAEEKVVEAKEKEEEVDFEIEDDTPEEDKGREPLPEKIVKELEEDELEDYSDRVRTRMAQLKKVWHDERRAKEATQREREEALRVAQQVMDENKRLKSALSSGEELYVQAYKDAAEREIDIAKREYREAYDAGDTDRVIEAQQRLTNAQLKLQQANVYRPQYNKETALQDNDKDVYTEPQRPQTFKPDPKAAAWQEQNPWFGEDSAMTGWALGLHEKLVRQGVDPKSDEYYNRINYLVRETFPKYFGATQEQVERPTPRAKPNTVVAPATRSTAPKKIVLTKTQVSLAKKLGITPEQYAREVMMIKENQNG